MKKTKRQNNYAFIDSQNLNLGVRSQGWKLDFGKFRQYLITKYQVKKTYLFIGYVQGNQALYTNYNKAIIVSGDGDFHCLLEYLDRKNKLLKLLVPNKHGFSRLLRKFRRYAVFIHDLKNKIRIKKEKE